MLNSKKILFILPDVAYSAELLPDKKPFSFAIQSCVQVNGSFIADKGFNIGNLSKLFAKLDQDESYQVILPDDLFTNTILTIKETGDAKIKDELKGTILPSLSILQESHDILTTVLNELRGTTRVQLSAIEKTILAPLRAAATNSHITVERIAPLSWSLKGIVSLEPSVVVIQLGSMLYGSLHYIGVEQCFSATTDALDTIIERIQQLKKDEPSIMTCYLLTNALVESGLKTGLKQVLPIQQMTEQTKDHADLPAAVATTIEEAMRTLSIADFPVPQFTLGTPTTDEVAKYAPALATAAPATPKGDAMPTATQPDKKADAELPKPHVLPTGGAVVAPVALKANAKDEAVVSLDEESEDEKEETATKAGESSKTDSTEKSEKTEKPDHKEKADDTAVPVVTTTVTSTTPAKPALAGATLAQASPGATETKTTISTSTASPIPVVSVATGSVSAEPAIDLRQFAGAQSNTITTTDTVKPVPLPNKSRSMSKMITIALLVFIGTLAAGVGLGMLFINKTGTTPSTPVVEVQASPTPAPTPEPTPEPASGSASATASGTKAPAASASASKVTAAQAQQKILVVNATDKAGYAGQIKDKLVKAGFKNATAGNAKGTYTAKTDIIFQKKADEAVLSAIEKASGLGLTSDDSAKQEDPQGSYDAVIVLNQ